MFFHIDDSYVIDEGSDNEDDKSSDDDEDAFNLASFIGGKISSKRKLEADDFEREMNEELNSSVNEIMGHNPQKQISVGNAPKAVTDAPSTAGSSDSKRRFYEDIYFDSDSSDDEIPQKRNSNKQKRQHPVISNDDLFYDPNMDQEDQDWVDKRRQSHRPDTNRSTTKRPSQSDAVLNCPACMTTLCDDCQRHDVYKNQFRAMFVVNCSVNLEKMLQHKSSSRQIRSKKMSKGQQLQLEGQGVPEIYHPVHCSVCKTEVAVYDKDEVYHFFNVLASYS